MALTASVSAMQSAGAAVWSQLQQQQLQRSADQAESRAQALRVQARAAETTAARAQEQARTVRAQSSQADGDALNAQLSLARANASALVPLQSPDAFEVRSVNQATPETPVTAGSGTQPVINADGQTTGTLINVQA